MKKLYSISLTHWNNDIDDYTHKTVIPECVLQQAIDFISWCKEIDYMFYVTEFVMNPTVYGGYEVIGGINGEEFLLDPESITY